MEKPIEAKRVGRPPGGLGRHGEPEKIRDYPTILLTIRPSVKARLKAITEQEGRPAWRIVEDAVSRYVQQLPPKVRRVVEAAARHKPAE